MNKVSFNQVNVSNQDSTDTGSNCDQCGWVCRFIGRTGGGEQRIICWIQMYYMHMTSKQNINNKQMLKIRGCISISVSASKYNRDSKTRQRWPTDFF